MSLPDSTEYWWDVKGCQPYMGEIYVHISEICNHYKPESGNTLTSKWLNDINCHACKKLIKNNGNIYGLKEGTSPTQQLKIDKESNKFKHGKCDKCGSPMSIRKNKMQNINFLGCCNYPKCKFTKTIN
ncbi:topoisomerase DNA-binding C4 zinc finger domain-containing protein [Chryseobacterium sp. MYb328]|uniref:topoisomerase DNA-binding C4 zinc finger domain-containing protein n=1 Tax=Chryseobacterium sp. MYb328 TaxID=2745231 RepID=UPI0030AA3DE8